MTKKRVVITGLGCVTSLSENVDGLFDALCESTSGIDYLSAFDTSGYTVTFGSEVKNFDPAKFINRRDINRMDRFTQFAVAAAIQAVNDSNIDFTNENTWRAGAIVGSGIGGIYEIEHQHIRLLNKGPKKVSPFCVPRLMGNAASGNIAILYGLQGPNICIVSACASGSHSIGEAFYIIQSGRSDIMLTGGSEAALTPVGLASFCSAKSLSTRNEDPCRASRPFDIDRDGFVLGEGAGIVILEEYEHAKARGAKIYAEVLGYGATDDGYHITAPLEDGSGAAMAMSIALEEAGIGPEQVDYINAHGTSTQLNDAAESKAIRKVFGGHSTKLAVSSTKGCIGHLLGAAGAVEMVICCKAIERGAIPPTANLDKVDPVCGEDMDFVPKEARDAKLNVVMSNSLGFGGHNASLVIGRV